MMTNDSHGDRGSDAPPKGRLSKDEYLDAFRRESDALIAAVRRGLKPMVPSCPAWSVGSLAGHMVGVYAFWNARLRGEAGANVVPSEEEFSRYPGLLPWLEKDTPPEETPEGVEDWLVEFRDRIQVALSSSDPQRPVDTWFPPDQTAGFVQRRMAQETAVHRWDAQSAHGNAGTIEPDLARDGIDEMLDVHLPMRREWIEPRVSSGERYHFHQTDGEGEWLVEFGPEGVRVSREHAKGDGALRGTASDLLLWLWGRVPAGALEVLGDQCLARRWFELVPAD